MASSAPTPLKFVVVGVRGCGKHSLVNQMIAGEIPDKLKKTPLSPYTTEIDENGHAVALSIVVRGWNRFQKEFLDQLYIDADLVMLCLPVHRPCLLKNCWKICKHELRKYVPDVPVILVATKSDLREYSESRRWTIGKEYEQDVKRRKLLEAIEEQDQKKHERCSLLQQQRNEQEKVETDPRKLVEIKRQNQIELERLEAKRQREEFLHKERHQTYFEVYRSQIQEYEAQSDEDDVIIPPLEKKVLNKMAKKIKAAAFMECSATQNVNVSELLDSAITVALKNKQA